MTALSRTPRILLATVVAILVGAALTKDLIAKTLVTAGLRAASGLQVRMARLHVGLLKTVVEAQGLQLLSPPGFTERVMVDVPELYVDYDLGSVLTGSPRLRELRLHVRQVIIERNAQGELNFAGLQHQTSPSAAARSARRPAGQTPRLAIDRLRFRVGTVLFKDYSKGPAPSTHEFRVNIDEQYTHVHNPQAVVSLILAKALAKTTITRLASIDMGALTNEAAAALTGAAVAARQAGVLVTQTGRQLTTHAQQELGQAADALTFLLSKGR